MNVQDFEFNGSRLYDFNMTCIQWDGDNLEASPVSELEFTTNNLPGRSQWDFVSAAYKAPLSAQLQIGSYDCTMGTLVELTPPVLSQVMYWLNRRDGFKPLRFPDEPGYEDLCFYAQINAEPLKVHGKIYGLQLSIMTNRPFAVRPRSASFSISAVGGVYKVLNNSDESGSLPVSMQITARGSGTLKITNASAPSGYKTPEIVGVSNGDVIVLDSVHQLAYEPNRGDASTLAQRFN